MSVRTILGVAAVMAVTGAAIAANTKIKAFSAAGDGQMCNPNVDGMAIFKAKLDPVFGVPSTEMHLHMQDLQPNQEYVAVLRVTGEGHLGTFFRSSEPFMTNASGNATIEVFFTGLEQTELGCTPTVQIIQDLNSDSAVTTCELRAQGTGG